MDKQYHKTNKAEYSKDLVSAVNWEEKEQGLFGRKIHLMHFLVESDA